jgi:hypothetical protein
MPFCLDVRKGELYLPINTPGPNEGRVESLDLVGGHNDLDIPSGVKTVQLIQQFQHRSLDLAFTT